MCQGKGRECRRQEKFSCWKKEGNIPALSGEVIMESIGITEEEVNFNTPVSAPHIGIFKGPPS